MTRPASGSFIAVTFAAGGGPIWRVDPATGRKTLLAGTVSAGNLVWSPDGKILMFDEQNRRRQRFDLHAVDARGKQLPLLVRGGYTASFSPDGRRIVFACGLACFATSSPDGTAAKLLFRCRCAIYEPKWSPRGDRIAYTRQHDRADGSVTYTIVVRTFAGQERSLSGEEYPCKEQGYPAWSPDGKTIAFSCEDLVPKEIYLADTGDGAGPGARLLTAGSMPAWSPDGKHIAFARESRDGSRVSLDVADVRTGAVRPLLTASNIASIAWRPAP